MCALSHPLRVLTLSLCSLRGKKTKAVFTWGTEQNKNTHVPMRCALCPSPIILDYIRNLLSNAADAWGPAMSSQSQICRDGCFVCKGLKPLSIDAIPFHDFAEL